MAREGEVAAPLAGSGSLSSVRSRIVPGMVASQCEATGRRETALEVAGASSPADRVVAVAAGVATSLTFASVWVVIGLAVLRVWAGGQAGTAVGVAVAVMVVGVTCLSCWFAQPVVSRWVFRLAYGGSSQQ